MNATFVLCSGKEDLLTSDGMFEGSSFSSTTVLIGQELKCEITRILLQVLGPCLLSLNFSLLNQGRVKWDCPWQQLVNKILNDAFNHFDNLGTFLGMFQVS